MRSQEEILQMKLKARDLEIIALKDALFIRNQMIQRLDTTIADLNTELNDRDNQLEENNNKEGEAMGFALGFAHFLLCFYNTSEEGMSLCWHDVDNKTKHDTKEVFEIYLKTLK